MGHTGKVMASKVQGSRNLHIATKDVALDFFVMFSSATSVMGNKGQANYAAANGCLDATSDSRRMRGQAAVSVQWGPWADVGMAAAGALVDATA